MVTPFDFVSYQQGRCCNEQVLSSLFILILTSENRNFNTTGSVIEDNGFKVESSYYVLCYKYTKNCGVCILYNS